MSFLAGFYTFVIELSNVERGVYEQVKTKCSRHVGEDLEFFLARHVAFAHSYVPNLKLLPDASDARLPIFKRTNASGEDDIWGFLGNVDARAIRHSRKSARHIKTAVYFYSQEQLHKFCRDLRGATENWVAGVEFFFIEPDLLDWLCGHEATRTRWDVTITDNSTMFLTVEDDSFCGEIVALDIWEEYQRSLRKDLQVQA